jgi:hypothetical protein
MNARYPNPNIQAANDISTYPRSTGTKRMFEDSRGSVTMIATQRETAGACRKRQCGRPWRGRLAIPRSRADLRNHGAAYGCSSCRPAGYALLGRARCVTADRNGPDVLAHECLPFGALAEADLQPAKRCPPVRNRRSPNRTMPNLARPSTLSGDDDLRLLCVPTSAVLRGSVRAPWPYNGNARPALRRRTFARTRAPSCARDHPARAHVLRP